MSINPSQSFLDKLRQATQALITQINKQGRARAHVRSGQIDHSLAESNIFRRRTLIPKPETLVERRSAKAKKGTHPQGLGLKKRPMLRTLKRFLVLKLFLRKATTGKARFIKLAKKEGLSA